MVMLFEITLCMLIDFKVVKLPGYGLAKFMFTDYGGDRALCIVRG
jgi:hypothetical protein